MNRFSKMKWFVDENSVVSESAGFRLLTRIGTGTNVEPATPLAARMFAARLHAVLSLTDEKLKNPAIANNLFLFAGQDWRIAVNRVVSVINGVLYEISLVPQTGAGDGLVRHDDMLVLEWILERIRDFGQIYRSNISTATFDQPVASASQGTKPLADCKCIDCLDRSGLTTVFMGIEMPISSTMMVLCQLCGNKRCPHAKNHELVCTNSNEPGQKGSAYEDCQGSIVAGPTKDGMSSVQAFVDKDVRSNPVMRSMFEDEFEISWDEGDATKKAAFALGFAAALRFVRDQSEG